MKPKNTTLNNKDEGFVKDEVVEPPPPPKFYKNIVNLLPEKKPSNWQKKFLGISVWGWVVMGLILVWAGITVGIVAGH